MGPEEAFKHLSTLDKLSSPFPGRKAAAEALFEIAKLLGPNRVRSELLPYLADIIEGPPSFPLLPSIGNEELALEMEEEAIEIRQRPTLSVVGMSVETRQALNRAIAGAGETDYIFEIIARQIARFVPNILPVDDSVLIIGLLCQLASSPDVGVRSEAIKGTLCILKQLDCQTLLRSGCIDLVFGMATSDIPYKRASVAYMLPLILKVLLPQDVREEEDAELFPLQEEIIKLFFGICSGSTSSVARRAFALNFMDFAGLLLFQKSVASLMDCRFNMTKYIPTNTIIGQMAKEYLQDVSLKPVEKDFCAVPYIFADERAAEIRALAIPSMIFLALIFLYRWYLPRDGEELKQALKALPSLSVLARRRRPFGASCSGEKRGPMSKKDRTVCPRCKFEWPATSKFSGVFSLALSPTFESFIDSTKELDLLAPPSCTTRALTKEKYVDFCVNYVKPLLERSLNDEWIARGAVLDALPLILDIVLPFWQPADAAAFLESAWLHPSAEDEHIEVRASALQRLPLMAYLFSQSPLSSLFDKFDASNQSCPLQIRPSNLGFENLPRFLERCSMIIQAGITDQERRVRLISAQVLTYFLLMVKRPELVADNFISPFLTLLRDPDAHVVVSLLGCLKVLTSADDILNQEGLPDEDYTDYRFLMGSRSGLTDNISLSNYLPVDSLQQLEAQFNNMAEARALLDLLKQAIIPAVSQCLVATNVTQPIGEMTPLVVPAWRIRCAMLHVLPALDQLVGFSDISKLKTVATDLRSAENLLNNIRLCLIDKDASTIRYCAAECVVDLGMRASPAFIDFVIRPILQEIKAQTAPISTRFAVPLIVNAFARRLESGSQADGAWVSIQLIEELLEVLQMMSSDRVVNVREAAEAAKGNLLKQSVVRHGRANGTLSKVPMQSGLPAPGHVIV